MSRRAGQGDDEGRASKHAGRKRGRRWAIKECTCWACEGGLRDERTVALHAKRPRHPQLDSPLLNDVEDELPFEVLCTQDLGTRTTVTLCARVVHICLFRARAVHTHSGTLAFLAAMQYFM